LLAASDQIVLNLETPILERIPLQPSPKVAAGYPVHHGKGGPTESTLKAVGVTALALGNNHAMDQGAEGLVQTLAALDKAGIGYFGAGRNTMEASRPWHQKVKVGDKTLDLFVLNAYAYRQPYDKDFQFYATTSTPGVWLLERSAMAQRIRELRAGYPQAFIIIFPHWGWNYADQDAVQQLVAQHLIQAGADLILGHGAHRLQEIGKFQDRWILYSLGNFLFNTRGRYDQTQSLPYSLVARLLIEDRGDALAIRLRLYPIVSDNRLVHYQPRPVTLTEFHQVKEFLKGLWPEGKDGLGYFLELTVR
jgi:poly-gamma-glutamate capsule biosynthesis protein CapA/YwtB (metallophosphatase superfamily)